MCVEDAANDAVSSAAHRFKRPGIWVLWGYRALAVGSALALVVLCYSGPLPKDSGSSTPAYLPTVCCIAVLGIAYYLGRTRRLAQRLNLGGRVVSVIPIAGLIFIPSMGGLSRLTRRRLYLRNVAIFAATALVQLSSDGFDARSLPATTLAVCVLCLVTPVLAVVLSRRVPASTTAAPPGGIGPAETTPAETGRPSPVSRTAAVNPDLPAPSQVLDVTAASTLARRLYWLGASMKFGAIFVALGILAPNGPLQLSWAGGIVASVAIAVGFAAAFLLQEDRLRPAPAVICGLAVMSAVCFIPVAFGVGTSAAAATAVSGWAICVLPVLWLYRRQRRSSGLKDADVQAMSRVGHLPSPTGGRATARRPLPPLATWLRGLAGLVLGLPVVLLGMVNTLAGVLVFSDWIQAPLDKLYELARRLTDPLISSAGPRQPAIAVAESTEPAAWKLLARGDLLHWGKLGAQRVGFEEFLETRLEPYGELQTIDEACRRDPAAAAADSTSLVVMPVGAPLEDEVIDKVAGLAARLPVLLVMQPVRAGPMPGWAKLARRFQAHHLTLPVLAEPTHTMAVLHLATGENLVYLAHQRNQWGYVAAIHAALAVVGVATAKHRASNPPATAP
jgi:hypothetical protein